MEMPAKHDVRGKIAQNALRMIQRFLIRLQSSHKDGHSMLLS